MFEYNLLIKPSFNINEKSLDLIFKTISNIVEKKQNWTLNIIFLDDNSIQNLNKKYRNIDKNTDILSFHYFEDFSCLDKEEIAWEIILCESKIISQWKEFWLWTEKEFYKLIIHWVLNILWYNHEKDEDYLKMNKLEEKICLEVFWK